MRQLNQKWCNFLLDRRHILQINCLEIVAHDSVTDHLGRPPFLRLPVSIKRFLHACAATGAMCPFKAAPQAGVAMVAITEAIARHLVNHGRGPGCSLVRRFLRRSNLAGVSKLLLGQDWRQLGARSRRSGVEGRNTIVRSRKLSMGHDGSKHKGNRSKKMLHKEAILPQNRAVLKSYEPNWNPRII